MEALKKHYLGFIRKHDAFAKFRAMLCKHKAADIVAVNDRSSLVLFITNPDLAFEFLIQDNEVSTKNYPILQMPEPLLGPRSPKIYHFVYFNGPEALEKRSIYANFFNTRYFEAFTPVIHNIVSSAISGLSRSFGSMQEETPDLQKPARKFTFRLRSKLN